MDFCESNINFIEVNDYIETQKEKGRKPQLIIIYPQSSDPPKNLRSLTWFSLVDVSTCFRDNLYADCHSCVPEVRSS